MLPIETYIVGYMNPETKEVHLVLTKATNQVLAINQVRIQFPTNFQFCLLERLGKKMSYYKIYLLNKKDNKETLVEVEAENVDEAIYIAKNQTAKVISKVKKVTFDKYIEVLTNLTTTKVETK